MNDVKPHPLKYLLCEVNGFTIPQLKKKIDKETSFSVSEEELLEMLDDKRPFPWRLENYLSELALINIEGWDQMKCDPEEGDSRLLMHAELFLIEKKKYIDARRRLRALFDEYSDVYSVE
jgi:hypothetical protein